MQGLGLLTLSAVFPSWSSTGCINVTNTATCSPSRIQIIFFFFSLYLVAVAQGGHKPCVQAFGADQFDVDNPEEGKAKSSFFNWWYFSLCFGTIGAVIVLSYVQDNLSWVLGFGIPCIAIGIALILYMLGTVTYRFSTNDDEKGPFIRIGRVFVNATKNWKIDPSELSIVEEARETLPHQNFKQFK